LGKQMSTTRGGLTEALRSLAALDLLADDQRRLAREAAEKLATEVVYVAVIGEFKRGKSSLINALLGDAVLPTGVIPVTAAPTLVRFGETPRGRVELLDDTEMPTSLSELADFITEGGNPRNHRRVREVVVELPSPLLRPGLVLADTPGTGSVHAHNTEMTAAFLPRVDVALLVLTVDAPLSGAEAELLAAAGSTVARAAVCLNKVDLLSPAELEEAVEFVRSRIGALSGGSPVPVFPVSARRAGTSADEGLDALRRFLSEVAVEEREAVVGARARKVAEGLLSGAEVALSLERAAAAQPAERARTAREAFAEARAELERDAAEAVTLLLAACRETEHDVVEPHACELRAGLPRELLATPDEEWPERSFRAAEGWIESVQAELSQRVEAALDRHGDRLQERLETFVRSAGEVFGVALPSPPDVRQAMRIPEIRIETADEPGAVAMGIRQVRRHLPGRIGRSWREGARGDQAVEDADRLAGRLRYAAIQAVDRAARSWVRDVEGGWRSLSDSLAAAVARAERTADGTTLQRARLAEVADKLQAIRSTIRQAEIAAPPSRVDNPGSA
jgi:GTP-binding protein EngB required for normal cell division